MVATIDKYHETKESTMARKEITPKPIHEKIKKILEAHKGKNNKIRSREIAEKVGRPSKEDTHSTIRTLIKETIHLFNLPVGATGGGYFLINNEEELDQYKAYLHKRALETLQRGLDVEAYFRKYYGLEEIRMTTDIIPDDEEFDESHYF